MLHMHATAGGEPHSRPAAQRNPLEAMPSFSMRRGASLDEAFADVPAAAAESPGRVAAETAHRQQLLERDIAARAERNRRLAEGTCLPDEGPGGESFRTPPRGGSSLAAPQFSNTMLEAGVAGGVDPAASAVSPGELERERELTSFLERAVMSC